MAVITSTTVRGRPSPGGKWREPAIARSQSHSFGEQLLTNRVRQRCASQVLSDEIPIVGADLRFWNRSRRTRFQSADDLEPTRAASFERLPCRLELPLHHHRHHNGRPKAGAQTAKPRLRHADDGERIAVQANGLTKNARITAEALAPVAVGQYCHRMSARLLIVLRQE